MEENFHFVDQMRFKFGYQNNSLRNKEVKTNNWKQLIIYFIWITNYMANFKTRLLTI